MNKKYTLNEHYFDEIDTEEKAYFLGLLYADGYNQENIGIVGLNLIDIDKSILEKLNTVIEHTKPIYFQNLKKINPNHNNRCVIRINSKYLCKQLSNLGCVPNKSLILKFPTEKQVPNYLIRHFIRGYFDGDGSFSTYIRNGKYGKDKKYYIHIVSTLDFLQGIKSIVEKETGSHCTICREKTDENPTKNLSIGGRKQVNKFLNWLYKDSKIYLERKYKKYLEEKQALEAIIKMGPKQSIKTINLTQMSL